MSGGLGAVVEVAQHLGVDAEFLAQVAVHGAQPLQPVTQNGEILSRTGDLVCELVEQSGDHLTTGDVSEGEVRFGA